MITYEDFRDKRREYAFTKSVSKDPKDQDAARKIRTQMDYDDLKKQIGSKKKPQVAANAVVVKDVPENSTMIGIPAKAIRVGNKGSFRPYGVDEKVKDE